jgi:hypothetical protein
MARLALLVGMLIVAEGILGIAAPDPFLKAVRSFQTTPVIYLAAAIRLVFGVVLVRAAPTSRAPRVLRVFGYLMVIGGLLTPFVGGQAARVILDWWSAGGPGLVRVWAAAAAALGIFIVYLVAPKRRLACP